MYAVAKSPEEGLVAVHVRDAYPLLACIGAAKTSRVSNFVSDLG